MPTTATADLIIDKEFSKLVPPLPSYEFGMLEASCIKYGIIDPLRLWNGIILDGKYRHEISIKHNLPYQTIELEFKSRQDAKKWVISHHLGKRSIPWIIRKSLKAELSKKDNEDHKELLEFKKAVNRIISIAGYDKSMRLFYDSIQGLSASALVSMSKKKEDEILELLDSLINNKTKNLDTAKAQIRKNKKKKLQTWELEMARLIHEEGYTRFDAYCEVRKPSIKASAGKLRSTPKWVEHLTMIKINNPKEKVHQTIKEYWDKFIANHKITPFIAFDRYVSETGIDNIFKTLNILIDLFYFMDLIDCKSFKSQIQKRLNISHKKYQKIISTNPSFSGQVNSNAIRHILQTEIK